MALIGFFVHRSRAKAVERAKDLTTELTEKGHKVRQFEDMEEGDFVEGLDLLVSMGGDGTILRAVNLLGGAPVPVLGINFGHLGYLTAVEPSEAFQAIVRTLEGENDLEERMMLKVIVEKAGGNQRLVDHALNEVVVERVAASQTVHVGVSLDNSFFTSYAADGIIISTPTGSTAYAFSARGPIVDALHRSIQLTPVSAHMLFVRTLVLDPSSKLNLEVLGERPATCSVDGRKLGTLKEGDQVICMASDRIAKLVTFGKRDFLHLLKTKFGLEDR